MRIIAQLGARSQCGLCGVRDILWTTWGSERRNAPGVCHHERDAFGQKTGENEATPGAVETVGWLTQPSDEVARSR